MKTSTIIFTACTIACCAGAGASAAEVKLRLMRFDAPELKVSTAVTEIDLKAERAAAEAERAAKAAEAQAGGKGGAPLAKDEEIKPRAEFDRYCNYMRGIVIDGTHPFHRTYQGSYLGRSDEITLDLPDGEHRVDPGGHRFTVKGREISTDDPSLRVRDGALEVVLYPVTVIAVDGSAVRQVPAEVLRLPVSPRFFWGAESILPKEELVAEGATFKRLTLYMMANTQGMGYRIVPSERAFHIAPSGVTILDEQGKPASDRGVYAEGKFTVVLPKVSVPVVIRGEGVSASIAGPAGSFSGKAPSGKEFRSTFYAFSAEGGANVRFGLRAENGPFLFRGDFGTYPRRKLLIDAADRATREPRLLAVALPPGSAKAGGTVRIRIEARDAIDAATITPLEVAAWLFARPVLRDDALLESAPDAAAPLTAWRSLRIEATDQPDTYLAHVPADLPSNVYWIRIVADARGACSPPSALAADFVQGVINPAARSTLSAFCPAGRHAYLRGADVPFSIVAKTTVPIPAGTLSIVLKSDREEFPLVERPLPELAAGCHPFHYTLAGSASAALKPGTYLVQARIAGLASNAWRLDVVEPRDRAGTPYVDDGWLAPQMDVGSPFQNVPADIREANDKRELLRRNTISRARRGTNIDIIDWSMGGHGSFHGRDSSSEVAQVEMLLRSELALPAHEVFYYQNHVEAVNESLTGCGIDNITSTPCIISILSLVHSLKDQVDATMRQHQLIAQVIRKFENHVGLNPMFMSTSPLGNSEIPDPTRHLRLKQMEKNFEKKYGYSSPTFADVIPYVQPLLSGKMPNDPKVGERWENYMTFINTLMFDFYDNLRHSLGPLHPTLQYSNRGPSWVGDTESGTYPGIANANQSPLPVFTGHGDYSHWFIWWMMPATEFYRVSGHETWGICGAGNVTLYRHHLGMALMSGAKGFGYLRGGKPEANRITGPWLCDDIDEMLQIRDLLRTFGPILRKIDHASQVGVYYPFVQSMYDTAGMAGHNTQMTAMSAMMQLSLLGYSYDVVTDEMIDARELSRFKVIVAPLMYYLLPKHVQALEAFAENGGTLITGTRSTIIPKGTQKIDDDFQELPYASGFWDFNAIADVGHAWVGAQLRQKAPVLRKAIEPVIAPHARPQGDSVVLQTGSAGSISYTYVVNFLYPSWLGTGRITGRPEHSAGNGEGNESTIMPQKPLIDFPAGAVVYDLFSHTKLSGADGLRPAADGGGPAGAARTAVQCDMSFSPFRVLVALPAEIAQLKVDLPESATLGTSFPVSVAPLDAAGKPIDGTIPVEVAAFDAAGQLVASIPGISGPGGVQVPACIGFKPGAWKLRVTELVGGRIAETDLRADAPQKLPFGDAVREVPRVAVERADQLRSFIQDRAKDKAPVLILLDEDQYDPRLPVAQALAAALKDLGVASEIRRTNAPGVFATGERMYTFGGRFVEPAPMQYIDHHVALIGGEGESVLVEELQNNQLFERQMTQDYPGPGRAVLSIVRSPFAYQRGALCLLGSDNDGLMAAAEAVKSLPNPPAPAVGDAAQAAKIVSRMLPVSLPADAIHPEPSGNPVQVMSRGDDGSVAIGTSGYAKNVFVIDPAGKLAVEDMVGHIDALGISLLPGGRMLVNADGTNYLRTADGQLAWQLRGNVAADPRGRYLVHAEGGRFHVYDLDLKPLWGFDEWDQYETTKEILFGRKASFIGTLDGGDTIVYRVAGKAPGAAGAEMDAMIFADALTGKETRSVPVNMDAMIAAVNPRALPDAIHLLPDGFFLATFQIRYSSEMVPAVLLDPNLQVAKVQTFGAQPYFGAAPIVLNQRVVWEHRQAFTVGDRLYLSNPEWTDTASVQTNHQILGLAVDEPRRRLAVSNYAGELIVLDEKLSTVWQATLPAAARLAFLPDGRLIAGTVRGDAVAFSPDGTRRLWEHSLKRYASPDEVEKRWLEVEQAPRPAVASAQPWWERLQASVDLGDDLAKLAGPVQHAAPLEAQISGEPFGTYFLQWRHGKAKGSASLSLDVVEDEQPGDDGKKNSVQRLSLSARAGESESTDYAILRLGDRPQSVRLTVSCSEGAQAETAVSVRPLAFPSKDFIRWEALYRGVAGDAAYVDPPVFIDVSFNVTEQDNPHTARRMEPTALVNGRMLTKELDLNNGLWWGSGTSFKGHKEAIIPTFIEITLPRKRVLTHVVIAEDPSLARAETLTVDAFVEAREVRENVADYEKRELARGFWLNVAKFRGNDSPYNVFKFDKPVYAKKLRIYVLDGLTSIGEIELYGALPK